MTASFLPQFRNDPAQPRSWLRDFRKGTPRLDRQALIDTLDLDAALLALAGEAPAVRETHYPFVVYVAAARALQEPATSAAGAKRQDLLTRTAALFDLTPAAVLRDVHAMMQQLRLDHNAYLKAVRRREKKTRSKVG
jgi:hypothetical protein